MVKLRVPQLMAERDMTAYGLAKASGGRISLSAAYRLARGTFKTVSAETLDALCDVFQVQPGELLTRDSRRRK